MIRRTRATRSQKSEIRFTLGAILTLLLCAPLVLAGQTQKTERYTVSGTIIDAVTKESLPFVNVFLASTALGAVTDTEGRFTIPNIPTGAYDLIISNPGYEREIRRVEIQLKNIESLRIALKEKVIETTPVEIVGEEPSVWRERLQTFEEELFGTTRNSSDCRVVNPEVLEFAVNEESGRFEASASSPVIIENRALGYRIEFLIRFFVHDDRLLKISGWPRFEELTPKDDEERATWERERSRAYHGSLRHFLSSLVNGTLAEEGFRISLVREISAPSRMSLIPDEQLREQIIGLGQLSFERQLSFEDYLKVEYLHEFQEGGFEHYWKRILGLGKGLTDHHQFSWIKLSVRPVVLSADGNPYDSALIESYGYWAYERVAEWLPLEYLP